MYLQHIRSTGYQPWRIKIQSIEQINIFFTTIALCFNTSVEFNLHNNDGSIIQHVFNPCKALQTLQISSRPTISNGTYFETWVSKTELEHYLVHVQHKV